MGMYSNNARGIFLLDSNTVTDPEKLRGKVDFIVAHAGKGKAPSLKFQEWVLLAQKLDVPVVGYAEIEVAPSIEWTWNPPNSHWPNELSDPFPQMVYRQTKLPNGQQLVVHGWIVDGSDNLNERKEKLPDTWRQGVWEHEINNVFRRMKKPVYPLIKKASLEGLASDGPMITYLSRMETVSTYEAATSPAMSGWGSHYIPGDLDAARQPYAKGCDFWWYGASPIPGVTGGVPLFLSMKDRANLYAELGFKPSSVVPPSDTGNDDPIDTGDNGDIPASLEGKIDSLIYTITDLTDAVDTLTALITPFFSKFSD